MIQNFSDHSANERTYLAWVRTGLGIAGLGLLVQKLQLLPGVLGLIGGLGLVGLACAVLILATFRFVVASREIDDTDSYRAGGVRGEVVLSGLLVLFILAFAILIWVVSTRATA